MSQDKEGSAATPAMQAYRTAAADRISNYMKTWMPVHRYYAQRVQQDADALKTNARGGAGADATAAGDARGDQIEGVLTNRGAGAGSGSNVMAISNNNLNTADAGAKGLTGASSAADRSYVAGLTQALNLGQSEQNMATQGLSTAAQLSNSEQQQYLEKKAGEAQGLGQLAGIAGGLTGGAKTTPSGGVGKFGTFNLPLVAGGVGG